MAQTHIDMENLHYQRGLTLLDQGQYSLAASEFEDVLAEVGSDDPLARLAKFHLGESHAQLGMEMLRRKASDRAEEELRRAIEINPHYPDLHYNLARALFNKGKVEEAMSELQKALDINPAFAKAYFERGLIFCGTGAFEQGLAEIGQAVKMDPAYSKELYDSACLLCSTGKVGEALERLSDLACTNLDDIAYHFQLGKDCYRQGKFNRAIAEFRRALQLHSGYADVHNYLGLALLAHRKPEEAREEFEAALDINPRFLAATLNAGDACAAMGDREAASDYYHVTLELDPENIEARDKLEKL